MVLDDKASSFLLQVRQAMAASSGSPVSADSIPLEEVAAAVEASGGGFSSVLNEVAAATLSNSVSILFFIMVSWSAFSSWCQFLSWILKIFFILFDCLSMTWHFPLVGNHFCASLLDRIFCGVEFLFFFLGISVPLNCISFLFCWNSLDLVRTLLSCPAFVGSWFWFVEVGKVFGLTKIHPSPAPR